MFVEKRAFPTFFDPGWGRMAFHGIWLQTFNPAGISAYITSSDEEILPSQRDGMFVEKRAFPTFFDPGWGRMAFYGILLQTFNPAGISRF